MLIFEKKYKQIRIFKNLFLLSMLGIYTNVLNTQI